MDEIEKCSESKVEMIQSCLLMLVKDSRKVFGAIDTEIKMYVGPKTNLIPERGYIGADVTADSLKC
jgi:hypothetical protein